MMLASCHPLVWQSKIRLIVLMQMMKQIHHFRFPNTAALSAILPAYHSKLPDFEVSPRRFEKLPGKLSVFSQTAVF